MENKFWPEISQKYGIQSPGDINTTLDRQFKRPTKHQHPGQEFKDLFVEIYYEDCKLFGYDLPF